MRKILLGGLALAGTVTFLAAGRAAETVSAPTDCLWPAAQDAIQAAPLNHRVIFENDHVRVLDVIVPPHTKENIHAHCWPSVLYIIEAGQYVDYDINGKVLFDSRSLSSPPALPMTLWKDPEAPHAVHNIDDRPLHLVRVELKPQAR
ncbi:MAG: hypothetical protein ABI587_06980 [Gemmatimonadales bacterium]